MAIFRKPEDYKGQVKRFVRPSDDIDPKLKREKEYYLSVAESMVTDFASGNTLIPFEWYSKEEIQNLRDYARGRQSSDIIKKSILSEKRRSADGRYLTKMNVSFEGYAKLPQMFDMMRSKNMGHEYDVDIKCVDMESVAAMENQRAALKYLVDKRTSDFTDTMMFKPEMEVNPQEIGVKTSQQVDVFIDSGGFTPQWMKAAIAACHKTKIVSNYKEFQDLCMDDLITNPNGITGARTYIDRSTGEPKVRHVDIRNAIVPYFKGLSSEGKISRGGELVVMSIADLRQIRPDLKAAEMRYIAKQFEWMNPGYSNLLGQDGFYGGDYRQAFQKYDQDPISRVKILVLDYQFLSTDTDKYIKNEDRGYFREVDYDYVLTSKAKKNGDYTVEKKVIRKHEARWIVGTKYFLDFGVCDDAVYYGEDGNKTPSLDFFFVKTGNMSLVERCKALVDDMNLILVKHRNIWATLPAAPGMLVQKNLIENVFLNNKKQQPEDLMQAMIERGLFLYDSLDDFNKPLFAAGGQKPIEFLDFSKIAALLSVCTAELQVKVNEIREVLGLTQGADAGERSPYLGLGEQQLAIEQANSSLAPTFNAYRYLFKAVFNDIIKKWQIMARKKKGLKLGYSALGNTNMRMLELAGHFTAADFNCEVTIGATREDKMALLQELRELRVPADGTTGITYAEYMFVRDRIMDGSIKEAQLVMSMLDANKRAEKREIEERNISANLEGQQESARMKSEADQALQGMKGQSALDNTMLAGLLKNQNMLIGALVSGGTKTGPDGKKTEQGPDKQAAAAAYQQTTNDIAMVIEGANPPEPMVMQEDMIPEQEMM